jgi:hypothetical protein
MPGIGTNIQHYLRIDNNGNITSSIMAPLMCTSLNPRSVEFSRIEDWETLGHERTSRMILHHRIKFISCVHDLFHIVYAVCHSHVILSVNQLQRVVNCG